jgi:hypothetical protein
LRFADAAGIAELVEEMKRLAGTGEARFAPCALLEAMVSERKQFYRL